MYSKSPITQNLLHSCVSTQVINYNMLTTQVYMANRILFSLGSNFTKNNEKTARIFWWLVKIKQEIKINFSYLKNHCFTCIFCANLSGLDQKQNSESLTKCSPTGEYLTYFLPPSFDCLYRLRIISPQINTEQGFSRTQNLYQPVKT